MEKGGRHKDSFFGFFSEAAFAAARPARLRACRRGRVRHRLLGVHDEPPRGVFLGPLRLREHGSSGVEYLRRAYPRIHECGGGEPEPARQPRGLPPDSFRPVVLDSGKPLLAARHSSRRGRTRGVAAFLDLAALSEARLARRAHRRRVSFQPRRPVREHLRLPLTDPRRNFFALRLPLFARRFARRRFP